jgi:hypothetical protein
MLQQAFEALKTYDWGTDRNQLAPIDAAIISTRDDAAARKALEDQMIAALNSSISRDAKDTVCRWLMIVGTANSVPALAELLPNAELSHMGRYALERIPAAEAGQALLAALPKVSNELKIGVLSSLAKRTDVTDVAAIAALLTADDGAVARSAALALGTIGSPAAAKALADAKPNDAAKGAATDSKLACAERLLAAGNKVEALGLYKSLVGDDQPKQVRLAATRGMLACAGN